MKYIRYLWYVIRHKWFVMIECFRLRIYWQGITHDMSKLLLSEFMPYMEHFYGSKIGISKGRDETGYYKPTDTGDKAFDFAWLLHQKRNKHHWQWWTLPEDGGGLKVLDIPLKYRKEMLADWCGAGRAQGTSSVRKWYDKHKLDMSLGQETRAWIEKQLTQEAIK